MYSSLRLVLYFESIILLTFIHKYIFIHGLRHTHRWISACLRKGECETEVHVCYYFIIRSANAVRSQTHTIVCAHTARVLWRLLWLLIQVSDNWELASANLFEFQHKTSICAYTHGVFTSLLIYGQTRTMWQVFFIFFMLNGESFTIWPLICT